MLKELLELIELYDYIKSNVNEKEEKKVEESTKGDIEKEDTTYRYNTEELRSMYNTVSDFKGCENISKETFEKIVEENLKKASNSVCIKDIDENKETLDELKAKTTVYPDPNECKILYAKTKSGKKSIVYEVMYINGMKMKSPVFYNKEGERL